MRRCLTKNRCRRKLRGGKLHSISRPYPVGMSGAAFSADCSPAVPDGSRGLASLSPGQPFCPGFKPEDCGATLTDARRFMDHFRPEADRFGRDSLILPHVPPKSGKILADWSGVLMPCLCNIPDVSICRLQRRNRVR